MAVQERIGYDNGFSESDLNNSIENETFVETFDTEYLDRVVDAYLHGSRSSLYSRRNSSTNGPERRSFRGGVPPCPGVDDLHEAMQNADDSKMDLLSRDMRQFPAADLS